VTFTAPNSRTFFPRMRFGGELIVADIGSPTSLIEAMKPWLFLTEPKKRAVAREHSLHA
jgi:hypothetical protein